MQWKQQQKCNGNNNNAMEIMQLKQQQECNGNNNNNVTMQWKQ